MLSRILLGFIGFSWGLSKFLACVKFLGCLLSCVFFSSGFYRLFGDGKMAAVGFGSLDSLGPAGKLSTDFYSANYRQRRVLETGRGDDWPFHKTLKKKTQQNAIKPQGIDWRSKSATGPNAFQSVACESNRIFIQSLSHFFRPKT